MLTNVSVAVLAQVHVPLRLFPKLTAYSLSMQTLASLVALVQATAPQKLSKRLNSVHKTWGGATSAPKLKVNNE
jgi:hypothetical protein